MQFKHGAYYFVGRDKKWIRLSEDKALALAKWAELEGEIPVPENEDKPIIMRRAKAVSYVLDNITIFITDHAQLVGYNGSTPNTIMWNCDIASFLNDEIYNDPILAPEPQKESLKNFLKLI